MTDTPADTPQPHLYAGMEDVPPGIYELTKRIEVRENGTAGFIDMPEGPDTHYVTGFWPSTQTRVRMISDLPAGAERAPDTTTGAAGTDAGDAAGGVEQVR